MASLGSDMATDIPLRLVENHLTSLRHLAQRLVGNPHDAEDALQETWLRALQSPPSGLDRLRGWLETVLRNVIRRQHRQGTRTRNRERSTARSAAEPPALDVVERQQQLGALTDAIRELPIELQECVFLRYFEGLPPRQIATRLECPVASVYRSLERAKIQLRRTLKERDEDWRHGLALLLGLRPTATALAVGGGIILSKKILAGAAIVLIAVLSYTSGLWLPEPTSTPSAPEGAAALRAEIAAGGEPAPVSREEEPESAKSSRIAELAPYEYELEIHTRNQEDLPASETSVLLAPEFHRLNTAKSDERGILRLRFRGRNPSMTLIVACPSDLSNGRRLRRLPIRSGQPNFAVIRVRSVKPMIGTVIRLQSRAREDIEYVTEHAAPTRTPKLHQDAEGLSWFVAGSTVKNVVTVGEFRRFQESANFVFDVEVESPVTTTAGRERVIRGTIRTADGRPAAKALLIAGKRARVLANDTGRFELKLRVPDGAKISLRAGGGDHGLAHHSIEVGPRTDYTWNPTLDRGLEFLGQLVDAEGQPLGDWRLEIQPEDGSPWIDGTKTNAAGQFAIPNVTERPYRVLLFPPKSPIPVAIRTGLSTFQRHVIPVLAPTKRGGLRVAPRTMSGKAIANLSVQLWNDSLGTGLLMANSKKPEKLLPGDYRIVVGAPGFAMQNLTQAHIESEQTTDLGTPDLGVRTVLELDGSNDLKDLWHLHTAVPTRVGTDKRQRVALPPGQYRVKKSDSEFDFEAIPGKNTLPSK